MHTYRLVAALLVALAPCASLAQDHPTSAPPGADTPSLDPALVTIRREAAALGHILESDLARDFLATAQHLPAIEPRTLYRDPKTQDAVTEEKWTSLPADEQARFKKRICDTSFYYTTGYGSPTIYARPLDILAASHLTSLRGLKVMDFGYGMIGQERMMALLGADVHGIDVEPMFALLYSQPGDTGEITSATGGLPASAEGQIKGRITLHNGHWPSDPALAAAVGKDYDLIISKNTLKRGYIHPARQTDPARLVHLGVSDGDFLKAAFEALKPGGLFLVYNISPKQAPPDKSYIPWADGEFPFPRELVEKTGFEIVAFDINDDAKIREVFAALEPDQKKTPESFKDDLFAHYTLLRRPAPK